MKRRHFITTALGAIVVARSAQAAPGRVEVYKSPTCGCCAAWVDHMKHASFVVETRDVDQDALYALKARSGITPELASCHTALTQGYVLEGHVPASDVIRLLAERPAARGLAVPGMPIGSPGMEIGHQREAFDTLLLRRDGTTGVFERHA